MNPKKLLPSEVTADGFYWAKTVADGRPSVVQVMRVRRRPAGIFCYAAGLGSPIPLVHNQGSQFAWFYGPLAPPEIE